MDIQQYINLVSTSSSLDNLPEAPDPSNAVEVEQCHQAYSTFLEQHPQERNAVIQRVSRLPSDSRWSATLLDWASEPGSVDSETVDTSISLLQGDLSSIWLQSLAGKSTPRLEQIVTRWTESDILSFLAACEKALRKELQSRLDIGALLFEVVSRIEKVDAQVATHPVFAATLESLLYDTNNRLFAITLKLYTLIIPFALAHLTPRVPLIMIVLGRAVNWRDRPFAESNKDGTTATPLPAGSSSWQAWREDRSTASALQSHAVVGMFLATVYNAWPSNVLAFVRDPVLYIQGKSIESVYNVSWPEVWPSRSLAARASPLLCRFHLHPLLVEHTSSAELRDTARWDKVDPSEFTARAHALAHAELLELDRSVGDEHVDENQDMDDGSLHREIRLLRSELRNSERLQRQYLFHIGRLHQETLRFDFDEAEINGMATRLKDQAKTIETLSRDLEAQHLSASKAQQKHVKWQGQLRDRLSTLREDRKSEQQELAKMRGDLSEAWAISRRQRDELALEKNMRSKIENEILEMRPRVSRIGDYETRIKQLTDSQRLWDYDVRKRKDAEAFALERQARCNQLEGMLQSANDEVEGRVAKIHELERRLAARPNEEPIARVPEQKPEDLARYIDIANAATAKIETLERELEQLRAASTRDINGPVEEKDSGTRAFLWG